MVAVDPSGNASLPSAAVTATTQPTTDTYGTQTSNTFSVQAVDSAGNRSTISSVTLDHQTC